MPFRRYTDIIDQLPGLAELHLQGLGEPLLHPGFFTMVRYAAARGIRVSTNSNLTILGRRRAGECVSSGLDCLHVSIDGAMPATYERIRRGARLDAVIENIEALQEERRRQRTDGPRLRLVTVVMRQNLGELPDIVRLAASLDMEAVFAQHLCYDFDAGGLPPSFGVMRRYYEEQSLAPSAGRRPKDAPEIAVHFRETRRVAAELGLELRLPRLGGGGRHSARPGCDWPWRGMYISYDGYVMPCCIVATPDRLTFGNADERPLAEIWSGEAYRRFRQDLASGQVPAVCRSCSIRSGTF